MIDDSAIDFLRNTLIETAISSLHVKNWNFQTFGHNRGQAAVRITKYQERLRLFTDHHIVGPGENVAESLAQGIGHNSKKVVRLPDSKLFKENLTQLIVMILPRMD